MEGLFHRIEMIRRLNYAPGHTAYKTQGLFISIEGRTAALWDRPPFHLLCLRGLLNARKRADFTLLRRIGSFLLYITTASVGCRSPPSNLFF